MSRSFKSVFDGLFQGFEVVRTCADEEPELICPSHDLLGPLVKAFP